MKKCKKILVGLCAYILLFGFTPGILNNGSLLGPATDFPLLLEGRANAAVPCDPNTDPSCPGPPSPPAETEETCETSSFTALEWIMCPVFKIGADLADSLLETFQEQLCFRTEENRTTDVNFQCAVTNTDDVKPVWNAMKNIASGLLVVIMLLMILAQATGRGPFA